MEKTDFASLCIVGLVVIVIVALFKGFDGVFLGSVMAIIGAIIGSVLGFTIALKKKIDQ